MSDLEKVISLENEIEASFMEDILNDSEIPFIIESHHSLAFDGIFQVEEWGYIKAERKYHQKIKELYENMLNNLEE
ncbi:MAG: hypothetical protein ACOC4G_13970 [Bacillota bacterium]